LISMSAYKCSVQIAKRVPCIIYSQYQRHCGTSRVGWVKFKDIAIKFGTIIFTNSKSLNIFQQNITISKYLRIWKIGGALATMPSANTENEEHIQYRREAKLHYSYRLPYNIVGCLLI